MFCKVLCSLNLIIFSEIYRLIGKQMGPNLQEPNVIVQKAHSPDRIVLKVVFYIEDLKIYANFLAKILAFPSPARPVWYSTCASQNVLHFYVKVNGKLWALDTPPMPTVMRSNTLNNSLLFTLRTEGILYSMIEGIF